jgi:integrase
MSGMRPSEAIGLRWEAINFEKGEISITESMPRNPLGNGYTCIRKSTKTGSIRVLSMTTTLRKLLLNIRPETLKAKLEPDCLVFTTSTRKAIDWKNYRNWHWKTNLEAAGVPYRKPYAVRHTLRFCLVMRLVG